LRTAQALHKKTPKDTMRTLSPMGTIADATEVLEAVVYLAEALYVAGEVLLVDGDADVGRW
jgi:NAD(P)-dependent dehydrogenase (short-subunit alcohol dehydrogenase family)